MAPEPVSVPEAEHHGTVTEQVGAGVDRGLRSREALETRVVSTGPDTGEWLALFERERSEVRQELVRRPEQAEAAQSAAADLVRCCGVDGAAPVPTHRPHVTP